MDDFFSGFSRFECFAFLEDLRLLLRDGDLESEPPELPWPLGGKGMPMKGMPMGGIFGCIMPGGGMPMGGIIGGMPNGGIMPGMGIMPGGIIPGGIPGGIPGK
mmetsp:Transcript_48618/g.113876  ORF Transcript_48618/g.113876 Transcript_48618/m.113876 type:complete len:103 (+) Transcript_48618:66-374(+)